MSVYTLREVGRSSGKCNNALDWEGAGEDVDEICGNLLLPIHVINIISIERLPIETTSATLCGIFSKENVENLLRKSLPRENFIPQTTSEGDNPALR